MAININELSVEFDVLYNNITSNQAPGLNGYEKSIFLNRAQTQLVQEYFNKKTDALGGIDGDQARQYDLSHLVVHDDIRIFSAEPNNNMFDQRSLLTLMPRDWMLTLNELFYIKKKKEATSLEIDTKIMIVKPISYGQYDKMMQKPYKYPPKDTVWRILAVKSVGSGGGSNTSEAVELIGLYNGVNIRDIWRDKEFNPNTLYTDLIYSVRYVKEPEPIILEDLSNLGVSIKTQTAPTANLPLPDEFYKDVLERAVTLAKIAWQGVTASQVMANEQQKSRNKD